MYGKGTSITQEQKDAYLARRPVGHCDCDVIEPIEHPSFPRPTVITPPQVAKLVKAYQTGYPCEESLDS